MPPSSSINATLRHFIEQHILPQYAAFDKAHREPHVRQVIAQSLQLAAYYPVNVDMVYTIAAYHDLGLSASRATHHLVSGHLVRHDARLARWFTPADVEVMAQAVEDHRASADHEPRSIYGKIVAEADRQIDPDTLMRRCLQYGLKHHPTLARNEQLQRALHHLHDKYGEGGYLRLWLPESPNAARLQAFRQLLHDDEGMLQALARIYEEETAAH